MQEHNIQEGERARGIPLYANLGRCELESL